MEDFKNMNRRELAGKWFDLQNKRGMYLEGNRSRFVANCLRGVGALKPMSKTELYNCCVNAQAALALGK